MKSDSVIAPAHYTAYAPMQPLEVCRHLNFNLGNAVKYACRAPFSGKPDDLAKGEYYLRLEYQDSGGRLHFSREQRLKLVEVLDRLADQVTIQKNIDNGYGAVLGTFFAELKDAVAANLMEPWLFFTYQSLSQTLAEAATRATINND